MVTEPGRGNIVERTTRIVREAGRSPGLCRDALSMSVRMTTISSRDPDGYFIEPGRRHRGRAT